MTTYEEAVQFVKEAEAAPKQSSSFLISPDELEKGIEVRALSYADVLKAVGFPRPEREEERAAQQQVSQARYQPQQPQPEPQPQPEIKQAPVTSPHAQAAKQEPAKAAQKPTKPRAAVFKNELSQAASKLESVAGAGNRLEAAVASAREQKQLKGLVLPTLSINDQISDLEKIDEGLKERVFDEEQLRIIKLEANGLARLIAEGKQPAAPMDLAELRNALLKEVLDGVGAYAV
ncbi:MAG: hypothetical protein ACP5T3_02975 [Candidatus Micrarchaeia archaeon]